MKFESQCKHIPKGLSSKRETFFQVSKYWLQTSPYNDISNRTHCKMWGKITYPLPNSVEVWGLLSNFTPQFTGHGITLFTVSKRDSWASASKQIPDNTMDAITYPCPNSWQSVLVNEDSVLSRALRADHLCIIMEVTVELCIIFCVLPRLKTMWLCIVEGYNIKITLNSQLGNFVEASGIYQYIEYVITVLPNIVPRFRMKY